jgi:hypothetical protein
MSRASGRKNAADQSKKVDAAKNELIELSGENFQYAFQTVRLLHDQEGLEWLDAYQQVINRLRAEQRTAAPTQEADTK